MNELALLSAAAFSRAAWESVVDYVTDADLTAHGNVVWQGICYYYRRDPEAQAVEAGVLSSALARAHPRYAEDLDAIVGSLSADFGTVNVARELLNLKRDRAAETLQVALSTRRNPDEIAPLLDAYASLNAATGLLDTDATPAFTTPLADIIGRTEAPGTRIKLLPLGINRLIRGGVLPGHTIVVFGRVNVGKSTYAINATAGFLKQGKKVLYVENEDLLDDTALRIGCRLVGWTRDQAAESPDRFQRAALSRGYSRLVIPDPAPETPQGIEKLIMVHQPDVCVVNQARNLTVGHKDSVQQMDQIAKALRSIGKRRRVVMLLVTAAKEGEIAKDGRAYEKPELEMADCYSSRTGFPAAADVMIGYGSSKELDERGMACLTLCKSKLSEFTGRSIYVKVNYQNGRISDDA